MNTRSILAPVVLAIAVSSISALSAFAEPNTGGIGARAVAAATAAPDVCGLFKDNFQKSMNNASTATNKHNAANARDTANYFLGRAHDMGCGWAQ